VRRRYAGRRAGRPGRTWAGRPRRRPVRAGRRLVRLAVPRRTAGRRVILAFALLALAIVPLPVLVSDGQPARPHACQGVGCHAQPAWTRRLDGTWTAGTSAGETGNGGTVPAVGQAYVAAGGEVAVLGAGLSLAGYRLSDGKPLWQVTLAAPPGTAIMSVRAWPGVVTVGLLGPGGNSRTEVVISATTGSELRRYPAAVFGGAVAASAATTVVIGPAAVTSYANATGRARWTHEISGDRSWRADGQTLYLAQSPGGGLSSAPVTALKVINLVTGSVGTLRPALGKAFSGTLAIAADDAVVFASPSGVTAYSALTGALLWAMRGAVPEGTDPDAGLVYLTSGSGALVGVDPVAGVVRASVPRSVTSGAAAVYVVRDGFALGLGGGPDGQAWGYDVTARRVTWNSPALPWPHFYSDLSGLGGSAAASGGTVVITACPRLAASQGLCADPELVAFSW
jgi:PQQ-like domain